MKPFVRPARGFSLFELAVCTALVGVLITGLLGALAEYRRQAERVMVRHTVAAVRAALAERSASMLGRGEGHAVAQLTRENPVNWLSAQPGNYLGERVRPRAAELKDGHWYFDRADQTINYLLRHDTFSSETSKLLKFKVKLLGEPVPAGDGGRMEAPQGLTFDLVSDRDASTDH